MTAAHTNSQKKTYLSNKKKTALASINPEQKGKCQQKIEATSNSKTTKTKCLFHMSYMLILKKIIKPKTVKAGDKSEIINEHEACGFVCYDGKAEEPVIYRREDTV